MYSRLIRLLIGILTSMIGLLSTNSLELSEFFLVESGFFSFTTAEYVCRILPGLIIFGGIVYALYPKPLSFKNIGIINPVVWTFIVVLQIISIRTIPDYLPRYGLAELGNLNPYQGLIIALILATFFLASSFRPGSIKHLPAYLKIPSLLFALLGLFYPFIINYPPSWQLYGEQAVVELKQPMPFDSIAIVAKPYYLNAIQLIQPGKTPQLMAVMSLTCPYCKLAARRLALIKKKYPELAIWFLLTGNEEGVNVFHERTKSAAIPFILINDPLFDRFSGPVIPRVFVVDNMMLNSELAYWALTERRIKAMGL